MDTLREILEAMHKHGLVVFDWSALESYCETIGVELDTVITYDREAVPLAKQENEKKGGMDPEVKRDWVEALRSGRYIQGSGMLNYKASNVHNHFCCLGVLCDLVVPSEYQNKGTQYSDRVHYYGRGNVLPSQVVNQVGLKDPEVAIPLINISKRIKDFLSTAYNYDVYQYGDTIMLTTLNDAGIPFHVIADIIEEAL